VKNISFSMTTEQVRRHEKTVTRRLGWWNLKPGTLLQAVEKAQGLKKGEHVKPICLIRVVRVDAIWLDDMLEPESPRYFPGSETAKEGFPDLSRREFVEMFRRANGDDVAQVNRIEFEYV
jgi:hypothetical protein